MTTASTHRAIQLPAYHYPDHCEPVKLSLCTPSSYKYAQAFSKFIIPQCDNTQLFIGRSGQDTKSSDQMSHAELQRHPQLPAIPRKTQETTCLEAIEITQFHQRPTPLHRYVKDTLVLHSDPLLLFVCDSIEEVPRGTDMCRQCNPTLPLAQHVSEDGRTFCMLLRTTQLILIPTPFACS